MAYKKIRLLYADGDREALEPILTQLNAKGVKFSENAGQIVLAVLSENLYADPEKTQMLLNQLGAGGQNLLPMQLDKAPIPDVIMNALFASNIISSADREPEQIAQRIIDALPVTKNPLPKFFIAGALVLAALIGIFLLPKNKGAEAADQPQISIPAGLAEAELESVRSVVIIGNEFYYFTEMEGPVFTTYEDLASNVSEWDEVNNQLIMRWYSHKDGSEIQLQEHDLSFVSLMPNLTSLQMVKVKVTNAPDLSGHECLNYIALVDSEADDISWMASAPITRLFLRCDVDCSVLSESETLEVFSNNEFNPERRDWSNFSPPNLKDFTLAGGTTITGADLSGLEKCPKLEYVALQNVTYPDLNFLQNATQIQILYISDNDALQDISAISNLKNLWSLTFYYCPAIRDINPIRNCSMLQRIDLDGDNAAWRTGEFHDVSFLGELPQLRDITLHNMDLANLEFLNSLSAHQDTLTNLWLNGTVADWSGLAAFKEYERITLENRTTQTGIGLPYLGDVQLGSVMLRNFENVDLANLPNVAGPLRLENCGIRDLSSISQNWTTPSLELLNCIQLSSLDGLQTAQWASGEGTIYIYNCPRLNDWSALEGMELNDLSIIGGYSVPDLGTFRARNLRLDSIVDVEDLTFFGNMAANQACNIILAGMENVNDLRPLEHLHGSYLAVPPHLAEQAEDLVNAGNFDTFSIEYPQGGWELDNNEIRLLSLDELETQPKALLRKVTSLAIVGDMLVDLSNMQVTEIPSQNGGPGQLCVTNWKTGEQTIIDPSSGFISDLAQLQDLTGLQELQLWGQPLETLDGIYNFPELRVLAVENCPNLTDASYAFTMQNLQVLSLRNSPVQSIQGVQNLWNLWELDISGTKITDLSPLAQSDFSQASMYRGGVTLILDNLQTNDFSALASIWEISLLSVNGQNAGLWLDHLEGKWIKKLHASHSFDQMGTDVNVAFAKFIRNHPELEELQLQGNERLTHISALLELPNLQSVQLSHTMEEAIASLGTGYSFQLNIS